MTYVVGTELTREIATTTGDDHELGTLTDVGTERIVIALLGID
jgi:hypothetical protein